MARKEHGGTFGGIVARLLMLAAAFLLLMSYLSIVVSPAKAWPMSIFGLMFIPLAVLNLFLMVWAISRRSGSFLIPLIALLPSAVFMGRYVQFSSGAEERTEDTFKIVTYNIGHYAAGAIESENASSRRIAGRRDSVMTYLRSTGADVICLQEVLFESEDEASDYFQEKFKGYSMACNLHKNRYNVFGNVTLSRFPIMDRKKFNFSGSGNLCLSTDLKVGERTLRVYNCHLQSYGISIKSLVQSIGKDSTLARQNEEKFRRSITKRPEQVDLVAADIKESPYESIVTGDFNDNPMSYTYHKMSKGKKDAFVEAGKGFGGTFTQLWPFIRIDYILYPESFGAASYSLKKVKLSDHYPVEAEITPL